MKQNAKKIQVRKESLIAKAAEKIKSFDLLLE